MTEHEALWLIFRSGLSTSPIITAISGRGVGLDVVRENIERLNGWIEVDSTLGHGSRFTFSLPLTVTTGLVVLGITWACAIGLIGASFPAIRAARVPVAVGLQAQ